MLEEVIVYSRWVMMNGFPQKNKNDMKIMLTAFTEVAYVASGCAESCNMVLDWIKNTLKTLPKKNKF